MIYFILNSIEMIYLDLFDIVMMQSDLTRQTFSLTKLLCLLEFLTL